MLIEKFQGSVQVNAPRSRIKEQLVFTGVTDAGAYLFSNSQGQGRLLSPRGALDSLKPEFKEFIRIDNKLVGIYADGELNKALGRPENFTPITGFRMGVVKL